MTQIHADILNKLSWVVLKRIPETYTDIAAAVVFHLRSSESSADDLEVGGHSDNRSRR